MYLICLWFNYQTNLQNMFPSTYLFILKEQEYLNTYEIVQSWDFIWFIESNGRIFLQETKLMMIEKKWQLC